MTTTQALSHTDRIALTQVTGITLDGKPAKITGYKNDFATVRNASHGVEFAWSTAARIAGSHKGFKS